jgi:putative SOS response-associated peptidase YedK
MPVIFTEEDEAKWLDPNLTETEELLPLLKQYPSDLMEVYNVSTAVNSPKNDVARCIEEV